MCVVGYVVCVLGGMVLGVCTICGVCVVCVRWVWAGVALCVWWGPGAGREVSRGHWRSTRPKLFTQHNLESAR